MSRVPQPDRAGDEAVLTLLLRCILRVEAAGTAGEVPAAVRALREAGVEPSLGVMRRELERSAWIVGRRSLARYAGTAAGSRRLPRLCPQVMHVPRWSMVAPATPGPRQGAPRRADSCG